MVFPTERAQYSSDITRTIQEKTDVRTWVESQLIQLNTARSAERGTLYTQILEYCGTHLSHLPDVVVALSEGEFSQYRYARTVLEKIISSEKIARAIREAKMVASSWVLRLLVSPEVNPDRDLRLVNSFLQTPSRVNEEREHQQSEGVDENYIFELAVFVGQELTKALIYPGIDVTTEEQFIQAWHTEAERSSVGGNLYIILTRAILDQLNLDRAELSAAILEILLYLEERYFGLGNTHFNQRVARLDTELAEMLKDARRFKTDPYTRFLRNFSHQLEQFHNDPNPNRVYFAIAQRPRKSVEANYATGLFLNRQIQNLEQAGMKGFRISLPDGGNLVMIGRDSRFTPQIVRHVLKQELTKYFSRESDKIRYKLDLDSDFAEYVIEAIAPVQSVEKLKKMNEIARQNASGGMSAMSNRGDQAVLHPTKSEGDQYLDALGIKELTFFQIDKGIRCEVRWFNVEMTFFIDSYYQLQGLEGIYNHARLWLENLLLSYIAGIKQTLGEREGAPAKSGEAGSGIHFKGRRPFLKVLTYGHQSRKTDLNEPLMADQEEEEFMLTHFGVSLYTLNNVFRSIQESSAYLNKQDFEIILAGYEETIPEWMKMRTNAQSVWSIIARSIRRTMKRGYKVKFRRTGLELGSKEEPNVLKKAQLKSIDHDGQYFNITLVHEAPPQATIEVDPLHFWIPEVGMEMLKLGTGQADENQEN
jgi:hypothetical protein